MVLLIIIPMKNGYFIGNINPTFSGPTPYFPDRVKDRGVLEVFYESYMVFLSLGSEKFQGVQRTETFYVSLPK